MAVLYIMNKRNGTQRQDGRVNLWANANFYKHDDFCHYSHIVHVGWISNLLLCLCWYISSKIPRIAVCDEVLSFSDVLCKLRSAICITIIIKHVRNSMHKIRSHYLLIGKGSHCLSWEKDHIVLHRERPLLYVIGKTPYCLSLEKGHIVCHIKRTMLSIIEKKTSTTVKGTYCHRKGPPYLS